MIIYTYSIIIFLHCAWQTLPATPHILLELMFHSPLLLPTDIIPPTITLLWTLTSPSPALDLRLVLWLNFPVTGLSSWADAISRSWRGPSGCSWNGDWSHTASWSSRCSHSFCRPSSHSGQPNARGAISSREPGSSLHLRVAEQSAHVTL